MQGLRFRARNLQGQRRRWLKSSLRGFKLEEMELRERLRRLNSLLVDISKGKNLSNNNE